MVAALRAHGQFEDFSTKLSCSRSHGLCESGLSSPCPRAALPSVRSALMTDFSHMPTRKGFFAPERFEAAVYDCEVVGAIPKDMNGAFYRVGAEWLYPPKFPDDAILNADGHISLFRFRN